MPILKQAKKIIMVFANWYFIPISDIIQYT